MIFFLLCQIADFFLHLFPEAVPAPAFLENYASTLHILQINNNLTHNRSCSVLFQNRHLLYLIFRYLVCVPSFTISTIPHTLSSSIFVCLFICLCIVFDFYFCIVIFLYCNFFITIFLDFYFFLLLRCLFSKKFLFIAYNCFFFACKHPSSCSRIFPAPPHRNQKPDRCTC